MTPSLRHGCVAPGKKHEAGWGRGGNCVDLDSADVKLEERNCSTRPLVSY